MLCLGCHFMPALDVCLLALKEKIPKKNNQETNNTIVLPLKAAIKQFTLSCETVEVEPFVPNDVV